MGELIYTIQSRHGDVNIQFSYDGEKYGCLCTFPGNHYPELDAEAIKSLALLGAAVALARNTNEYEGREYVVLPSDVPQWILDAIDRVTLANEAASSRQGGEG